MTQLNTPYPATAYLTGFLRQHAARLGLEVAQADAALELFLRRVLPRGAPARARRAGGARGRAAHDGDPPPPSIAWFLAHGERYVATVDPVVRFLQGRDPALALRIAGRELLPEGPRFAALAEGPGADDDDPLAWAFGGLGVADRAKHLASLYIDDLADVIRDGIAPRVRAVALRRAARRERADVRSAAPTRSRASRRWSTTCSTSSPRELYARHAPTSSA